MPTMSQLVRKGRKKERKKVDTPALRRTWNSKRSRFVELRRGAPQKRGVVRTMTPRRRSTAT